MSKDDTTVLACNGLSMSFGGLMALDQLDLQIGQGKILGLIGPNGSGKTTFFNVLTGIYAPTGGQIIFQGEDISGLSPQQVYHHGIVRTFQRSRLCLSLSIFDNIMIGNHKRLDHGITFNLFRRKALREQFESSYEEAVTLLRTFNPTLANQLFEPVAGISMIDRRRIEVCRALISKPRLLLLDEPSAGMTHEETRHLMDDILQARDTIPGLTIILIEHEMNVIKRITDTCLVMNYGKKISEGAFAKVAADEEVKKAYLGTE